MASTSTTEPRGSVSLVTGGASGIGKAIAELMIKRGNKVVIADFNVAGAKALAEQFNKAAGETVALGVKVDTTSWDDQVAMFDTAKSTFGRVDYVFANAGIGENPFLPDELPSDPNIYVAPGMKTLRVNLDGQIYSSALAIQTFKRQTVGPNGFQGKLIITASVLGTFYLPSAISYSITKAGMLQFMCCASEKYAKDGITVNAVCPNFTKTGIVPDGAFWDSMESKITKMSTVVDAFEQCVGTTKLNGAALICNPTGVYQHPTANATRYKWDENSGPIELAAKAFGDSHVE